MLNGAAAAADVAQPSTVAHNRFVALSVYNGRGGQGEGVQARLPLLLQTLLVAALPEEQS